MIYVTAPGLYAIVLVVKLIFHCSMKKTACLFSLWGLCYIVWDSPIYDYQFFQLPYSWAKCTLGQIYFGLLVLLAVTDIGWWWLAIKAVILMRQESIWQSWIRGWWHYFLNFTFTFDLIYVYIWWGIQLEITVQPVPCVPAYCSILLGSIGWWWLAIQAVWVMRQESRWQPGQTKGGNTNGQNKVS